MCPSCSLIEVVLSQGLAGETVRARGGGVFACGIAESHFRDYPSPDGGATGGAAADASPQFRSERQPQARLAATAAAAIL
jgi:hypothetical protein